MILINLFFYAALVQYDSFVVGMGDRPESSASQKIRYTIEADNLFMVQGWDSFTPLYHGKELLPSELHDLLSDDNFTRANSNGDNLWPTQDTSYDHPGHSSDLQVSDEFINSYPAWLQPPPIHGQQAVLDSTNDTILYDDGTRSLQAAPIEMHNLLLTESQSCENESASDATQSTYDKFDAWWLELNEKQIHFLVARLRVAWGIKDPRTTASYIMKRAQHVLTRDEAMVIIYGAKYSAMKVAKKHQKLKNRAPGWLMTFNVKERKEMYLKYAYYHNMSHWTARTRINEFDNPDELQTHFKTIEDALIAEGRAYLLYENARLAYTTIDDAEAAILMLKARSRMQSQWYIDLDESAQLNVYKRALRIIPSEILANKKDRIDDALTPVLAIGLLRQNQCAQKEFIRALIKLS